MIRKEHKNVFFKREMVLLGEQWGQHQTSRIVQLDKGSHRLKFSFGSLSEKMPCSVSKTLETDDMEAVISCTWSVNAFVDIPDAAPILLELPIQVGGYQFDSTWALPPPIDQPSIFQRSTTLTFSIAPGCVVVRAHINKEAYYPGENVLLQLSINSTLNHRIIGIKMDVRNFVKVELPGLPLSYHETIGVGTDDSVVIEPGASLERTWPVEIPRNGWATTQLEHSSVGVYLDVSLIVQDIFAADASLRIPFIVLLQKPSIRLQFNDPVESTPNPKSFPWMLDDESPICCVCQNKFGILLRRHHCRNCGMLVCSKCAPKIIVPDSFGSAPQRVCNACRSIMSSTSQ